MKTVITSTFSAEYIAESDTTLEIQWLREFITGIFSHNLPPTELGVDNKSSLEASN